MKHRAHRFASDTALMFLDGEEDRRPAGDDFSSSKLVPRLLPDRRPFTREAVKLIGNDSNRHFAGAFASKTSLPPANVFRTRTSRIFSGAMENMSSLIRTMSANFPGVIEPFSLS